MDWAKADAANKTGKRAFRAENHDGALLGFTRAIQWARRGSDSRFTFQLNRTHVLSALSLDYMALQDAEACMRERPGLCGGYHRAAVALHGMGRFEEAEARAQLGLDYAQAAVPAAGLGVRRRRLAELARLSVLLKELAAARAQHVAAQGCQACQACGRVMEASAAFQCQRCQQALYCGPACQAAHWATTHKSACARLRALPPRPTLPVHSWPPLPVHRVTPAEAADALAALQARVAAQQPPPPPLPWLQAPPAPHHFLPLLAQQHPGPEELGALQQLLAGGQCCLATGNPLATAAASGSTLALHLLLALGADPNAQPPQQSEEASEPELPSCSAPGGALHAAIARADPAALAALLQAGGDPRAHVWDMCLPQPRRLFAPLLHYCALYTGQGVTQEGAEDWDARLLQCAELLLRAGADLEAQDAQGHTVLRAVCELMGSSSAGSAGSPSPTPHPATPLLHLLLSAGADTEAHSGRDPGRCLEACLSAPHPSTALLQALLGAGASLEGAHAAFAHLAPPAPAALHSPVGYLVDVLTSDSEKEGGREWHAQALQLLLAAGANPSGCSTGRGVRRSTPVLTPLAWAVSCHAPGTDPTGVVAALLLAGAHPDTPNQQQCLLPGQQPVSPLQHLLSVPAGQSPPGVLAALLGARAAISPAVVCAAAASQPPTVLAALLSGGGCVHIPGADGRRPVHAALARGELGVLQVVLDAGGGRHAQSGDFERHHFLSALLSARGLQAGAVALVLGHEGTRKAAGACIKGMGGTLLLLAARAGQGAGVCELLAGGAGKKGGVKAAREALQEQQAAEAGRGEGRRGEWERGMQALRKAGGV